MGLLDLFRRKRKRENHNVQEEVVKSFTYQSNQTETNEDKVKEIAVQCCAIKICNTIANDLGKVLNIKVCNPRKLHTGLIGKYHVICHYSYNLPLTNITVHGSLD